MRSAPPSARLAIMIFTHAIRSALETVLLVKFRQRCKGSGVILVRDLPSHFLSLIESASCAQCLPALVQPVNYIEVIRNRGIPLNEIPDMSVPKISVTYVTPDKTRHPQLSDSLAQCAISKVPVAILARVPGSSAVRHLH